MTQNSGSSSPDSGDATAVVADAGRKDSSTSTGSDGGVSIKPSKAGLRRLKKGYKPKTEQLGTLVLRQNDLESLMCMVASRMTKMYVRIEACPPAAAALQQPQPSKVVKAGLPVADSAVNPGPGRTSFTLQDGSGTLTDPFAIAWFLACYDQKASEQHPEFGARMMQWHSFAVTEIRAYLTPLMTTLGKEEKKDPKVRAKHDQDNNKRMFKLLDALKTLNQSLEKERCLIGKKQSLADVMVAVELLPLYGDKKMYAPNGHNVFVKDILAEDFKFIAKWFKTTTTQDIFKKAWNVYAAKFTPGREARRRSNSRKDSTKGGGKKPEADGPGAKGDAAAAGSSDGVDGNVASVKVGKNRNRTYRVSSAAKHNQVATEEPLDLDGLAEKPLKVLCLHAYRQNDVSFREKTGALRKIIGKYCEFTFICAPHPVLPMSHDDINQDGRGWWFSRENDYFKANDATDCDKGFDASLELIEKTFEEAGPFDGVLGFSQGAALATLLCLMRERGELKPVVDFKFAIMVASFKSLSSKHDKWYGDDAKKVTLPTLHVIGSQDMVIRKGLSEMLLDLFEDPDKLYHSGGHFVPARAQQKKPYLRFLHKVHKLRQQLPEAEAAASVTAAEAAAASTDDKSDEVKKKEADDAPKKETTEDSGLEVDDSKDEAATVTAVTIDENQNKGTSKNAGEDGPEAADPAAPVTA